MGKHKRSSGQKEGEEDSRGDHPVYPFGTLVWAKVGQYGWWPGQVIDPDLFMKVVEEVGKPGTQLIGFFGDSSYNWVKYEKLVRFKDFYEELSQQEQKHKSFQQAVEEGKELSDKREGFIPTTKHDPIDFWDPDYAYSMDFNDREEYKKGFDLEKIVKSQARQSHLMLEAQGIVEAEEDVGGYKEIVEFVRLAARFPNFVEEQIIPYKWRIYTSILYNHMFPEYAIGTKKRKHK